MATIQTLIDLSNQMKYHSAQARRCYTMKHKYRPGQVKWEGFKMKEAHHRAERDRLKAEYDALMKLRPAGPF